MQRPALIAHADWSLNPAKRWVALARFTDAGYIVDVPTPVGDTTTLLARLRAAAGAHGPIWLGVDFGLGVPLAWARQVGVSDFRDLLGLLGTGRWAAFFDVAATPDDISLWRPFYPARPGSARQAHLLNALNLPDMDALRRVTERARPGRRAACPLFWTMGGQQVGKATLAGWRELIIPARQQPGVAMWPFDGTLTELSQRSTLVLAETYPAECYDHLGIRWGIAPTITPDGRRRHGKRVQSDRAVQVKALAVWARASAFGFTPALEHALHDGLGTRPEAEDAFDALVGALCLVNLAMRRRPIYEPPGGELRQVEGWVLGVDAADLDT